MSFLVWLFSTSFLARLTPRLGRRFSAVSPPFSLSLLELSLEEEEEEGPSLEEEDGEGMLEDGDGRIGWSLEEGSSC
jgi:hypothetical protein